MKADYDLSSFVKEQINFKKTRTIKIDNKHIYELKASAWGHFQLTMLNERFKGDDEALGKEIIKTFLGVKALAYIEGLQNPVINTQAVIFITAIITGIADMTEAQEDASTTKK